MKEAEKIIKSVQLFFISCLHRRIHLVITSFLYPELVGPPTLQSDLGDHGSLLNLSFAQTVLPSLLILCGDVESNPGPECKSNI